MTIIMRPILAAAINYVRLSVYSIFFQKPCLCSERHFIQNPAGAFNIQKDVNLFTFRCLCHAQRRTSERKKFAKTL